MDGRWSYLKEIIFIVLGLQIFQMLTLAQTAGQSKVETLETTAPPIVSVQEKIDIYPKLQNAAEMPLGFINSDDAALVIVDAKVKATPRDATQVMASDVAAVFATDYVMQFALSLRNQSDKKITGCGLQFTDSVSQQVFFVYPNTLAIEAKSEQLFQIKFMATSGSPVNFKVSVVGVRFADGTNWKNYPLPPANISPKPTGIANPQVESKPRPLNSLRPRYSELARSNRVNGVVRLQVMVGADGAVKDVKVMNALPDGLTEEAIHVVKVLQFKPAMSKGVPVDYIINLEVAFVLS
ncbi:MAG: energy transducer TonB [Acidobacteriota bacterium]